MEKSIYLTISKIINFTIIGEKQTYDKRFCNKKEILDSITNAIENETNLMVKI